MTQKELSIVLRELACNQKTPLCKEWTDEWQDDTHIDILLDKFIKGHDFCIENDYPPLDFCRKNFDVDDLHRHNIYLDEEVEIEADRSGYYVFLGNCKGTLTVDGFVAVTVYVRHDSNINVEAFNGCKVFVSYYEQSNGECSHDGWSKIKKYDRRKE